MLLDAPILPLFPVVSVALLAPKNNLKSEHFPERQNCKSYLFSPLSVKLFSLSLTTLTIGSLVFTTLAIGGLSLLPFLFLLTLPSLLFVLIPLGPCGGLLAHFVSLDFLLCNHLFVALQLSLFFSGILGGLSLHLGLGLGVLLPVDLVLLLLPSLLLLFRLLLLSFLTLFPTLFLILGALFGLVLGLLGHILESGLEVARRSHRDVRLCLGVRRPNLLGLVVERMGVLVEAIFLNPELAPETLGIICLTLVFGQLFMMFPADGRLVDAIGLDSILSSKSGFVIWKKV